MRLFQIQWRAGHDHGGAFLVAAADASEAENVGKSHVQNFELAPARFFAVLLVPGAVVAGPARVIIPALFIERRL